VYWFDLILGYNKRGGRGFENGWEFETVVREAMTERD
jgi:hypothetical protein